MSQPPAPQADHLARRAIVTALLRNAAFLTAGKAVRAVAGFVTLPIFLYYLGLEGLGVWVLVSTFTITGAVGVFDLNLQGALINRLSAAEGAGRTDEMAAYFASAYVLFAMIGATVALAIAVGGHWLGPVLFAGTPALAAAATVALQIAAAQLLCEFLSRPCSAALMAQRRQDRDEVIAQLGFLVTIGGQLWAVVAGHGVIGLAVAAAAGAALTLIAYVVVVGRTLPALRFRPAHATWARSMSLLRLSGLFFGFRLAGLVFKFANRFIVNALLGPAAVGQLAIIERLQMGLLKSGNTFDGTMTAAAGAAAGADRRDQAAGALLRIGRLHLFIVLAAAGLCAALAEPLLRHWLGAAQAGLAPAVQVMALGVVLQLFLAPAGAAALGMGDVRAMLFGAIGSVLVNLAVTAALLGPLGVIAAPLGFVAGALVSTGVVMARLRRNSLPSLWPYVRQCLAPALPGGLLAAGLAWAAGQAGWCHDLLTTLAVAAAAGGAGGALFFTVGLEARDRRLVLDRLFGRWRAAAG